MYNNIGEKIKTLVSFITKLGIAVSVFFGIIFMFLGARYAATWIMLIVVIPLFLWISSFLLYGFGEMIDKLSAIEENTRGGKSKAKNNTNAPAKASNSNSKKNNSAFKEKAVFEDEYVDVVCPECGETMSFNKSEKNCQCPFCDCTFEI